VAISCKEKEYVKLQHMQIVRAWNFVWNLMLLEELVNNAAKMEKRKKEMLAGFKT
jgi:hypothetical protein